jgi:hypothetical protein
LIAVGAFAEPLGRLIAAALTGVKCFGFGHFSLYSTHFVR